jgi:Protein of unknown function (DUF998)
MTTVTHPRPVPAGTRGALLGRPAAALAGAIAAAGFVVAFTLEGAVRPGYDPVRHYVSQLSLGPGGWVQAVSFVVTGLLVAVFAGALRHDLAGGRGGVAGPVLIGVVGLGFVLAGLFPADPGLNDYPPGSTFPADGPSRSFLVHMVAGALVFAGLPLAGAVLARRFRRDPAWRGWAGPTAAAALVVFVLWAGSTVLSGDGSGPIDGVLGLVQRVYLLVGLGWLAAVSLRLHVLVRGQRPGGTAARKQRDT